MEWGGIRVPRLPMYPLTKLLQIYDTAVTTEPARLFNLTTAANHGDALRICVMGRPPVKS